MFKDSNIQYINIKQYDKQLKIDNQIFKKDKLIKTDHSSFIVDEDISSDCISKLKILQKSIVKTYITTICESKEQLIVQSDEFFDSNYEIRRLSSTFSIAVPKLDLEKKNFLFKNAGLDYVFSPFNILYNHINSHTANTNSLNILILNNTMYALILNDDKRVVYGDIKQLTTFNDMHDSEFTNDGLEGQKLFDEVHSLEVQSNITEFMQEFYAQSKEEVFCESISIFYTLQQLTQEQIDTMQESIMLEIEYNKVNIDDYLFSLAHQSNASRVSFIAPREKKNTKSLVALVSVAVATTLILGSIGFFKYQAQVEEDRLVQLEKDKQAKILEDKRIEAARIKLPNHIIANENMVTRILNIFDIIPYSVVLNELQLDKKDSTFVCSLLNEDIFENDLKPKLLKLYKTSDILLMQDNKPTFNAIIANSSLMESKSSTKEIQPNYRKNKFIGKSTLVQQLKVFLPKDSEIKFKSKFKSKYLTYNFTIVTLLKEPKDFLQFIEELNKKSYSINIKYPIEFAKNKNGIETTFNLQFHQFHKK